MNGVTFVRYEVDRVPESGSPRSVQTTSLNYDQLTNGTAYHFEVRAVNSAGNSPWSAPSAQCIPDALPAPPDAATLVYGDKQLTVNWTVPANLGTAITKYDLLVSPGSGTPIAVGGTLTTYPLTGLTNGTAYTVRIRATNGAGTTAYGATSAPETPSGLPIMNGTPTGINGAAQATVNWTAANANGSAILEYRVTVGGGPTILHSNLEALSETISGLTNGTTYNVTVAARNRSGWSAESAPVSVQPGAVPATMAAPTATAGIGNAAVNYTVPNNQGRTITSIQVVASGGFSGTQTKSSGIPAPGAGDAYTFTGLPNGASVQFTVNACNSLGCGTASPLSAAVTTPNTPGAPGGPSLSAQGPNTVAASWSAPANNGSAIDTYEFLRNSSVIFSGNTTSYTDGAAPSGSTITYQVRAHNAVGWGPYGFANVTTPSPPPSVTLSQGGSAPAGHWMWLDAANLPVNTSISYAMNDPVAGGSWGAGPFHVTSSGSGTLSLHTNNYYYCGTNIHAQATLTWAGGSVQSATFTCS